MLPLISSRISSGGAALPSAMRPAAEQIWPGVQYPHWNASWSMNACCNGWSVPSPARPSMVVTLAPSFITANVKQELTRRPSTKTVQAPHWPWSQPFFVPVRLRRSRKASSKVVHGAMLNVRFSPLTLSVTVIAAAAETFSCALREGFGPYDLQADERRDIPNLWDQDNHCTLALRPDCGKTGKKSKWLLLN